MTGSEFTDWELELLAQARKRDFGSPDRWITPGGYPKILARFMRSFQVDWFRRSSAASLG